MTTVTIDEIQAKLPQMIHALFPGEELAITENNRTIAKLIAPLDAKPEPLFGRAKGALLVLSEDEEHLADFAEYMP